MPPPIPQTLLCLPSDVYDALGTEGTELRLDDHNLASGQTITVTQDAILGATSISCMALTSPLLPGTLLNFDGGNMPAVVTVVVTAVGQVGDLALTVLPLPAAVLTSARAYDSGVNTALAQRLTKSCFYGTGQVKLYCLPRYTEDQLVLSWNVNLWATTVATRWLAKRLCRSCPAGLEEDYKTCIKQLEGVRAGQLNVDDAGTRTAGWPFVTNLTVDIRYDYNKVRVEPNISEGTQTQYGQYIDWNSAFYVEWL